MRRGWILGLLLLGGCASAWERYDESLYRVMREGTPRSIDDHRQLLDRVILDAERGGKAPPGGIYAEYAFYCWRLGDRAQAEAALDKEQAAYPQAKTFLGAFRRFLDTVTPIAPPPPREPSAEDLG